MEQRGSGAVPADWGTSENLRRTLEGGGESLDTPTPCGRHRSLLLLCLPPSRFHAGKPTERQRRRACARTLKPVLRVLPGPLFYFLFGMSIDIKLQRVDRVYYPGVIFALGVSMLSRR